MENGSCPPSNRVQIGYFVFGIVIGAILISLVVFIIAALKKFDEIIERYSTISAYCTNPKQYGSRWLMLTTTLIGVSLSIAYVAAYNSLPADQNPSAAAVVRFVLRLVVALAFPLVGLFYVSSEEEEALDFGLWQVPIGVSSWIHMIAAMSYFFVNSALNLWDSIIMISNLTPAAGTAWTLFALSILGLALFILFVVTQSVIVLLPQVDPKEMHHIMQEYHLVTKGGFFSFWRKKSPEQVQFEEQHRPFIHMRILYAVSFLFETGMVIFVTLTALLIALAKNRCIGFLK